MESTERAVQRYTFAELIIEIRRLYKGVPPIGELSQTLLFSKYIYRGEETREQPIVYLLNRQTRRHVFNI